MRSLLTRLIDSATSHCTFTRLFLAPCLLICLSCATPTRFPIASLKEGMAAETVRENFGAPLGIAAGPGGKESFWTYGHEERNWWNTISMSTVFLVGVG